MSRNSEALIVQTNSATFSGTSESRQQLAITRIRAIEYSRDILSVSTIGISAFINSNGEVISSTPENVQQSLVGELMLNSHLTQASKYGTLFKFLILGLFLTLGSRTLRRQRSK
jgi:apolipoprotein N-acyltransferase